MIWGPFLLALALGIVVSAGLYFAYMWPQVEPDDEAVDAASAATASTAPVVDDKSDSTPAAAPTAEANAAADDTATASTDDKVPVSTDDKVTADDNADKADKPSESSPA